MYFKNWSSICFRKFYWQDSYHIPARLVCVHILMEHSPMSLYILIGSLLKHPRA